MVLVYLWFTAKIVLMLLVLIASNVLYRFLYIPWRLRQKYKKYSNVAMSKKFYPFVGDTALFEENKKQNKGLLEHHIEEVLECPDTDFRLVQYGDMAMLQVCSAQALEEFEKLVPQKIDRESHLGHPIGNMMPGSFPVDRSSQKWDHRRKEVSKTIGINYCSRYIGMMNNTVDKCISQAKLNETICFNDLMSLITFNINAQILFGEDICTKARECQHIWPLTGKISTMKLDAFYQTISKEQFEAFMSPRGKLFPFLVERNLIEPYKSNYKNVVELHACIQKFVEENDDDDSLYTILMKSGTFTKEECLADTYALLFAGFDTTSHSLTSMLYLFKRNPEKYEKVYQELEKIGITKIEDHKESEWKHLYQNCDYLMYAIKECLRLDGAAPISLTYIALEDTIIRGVPISKGQKLVTDMPYAHHNPKQWHKPLEFIPERFDTESEYFYKPGTDNQLRSLKSYIPFTFGPRNCVGQTLAKLEMKVVISRLITKMRYEISEAQLNNPYAKFNLLCIMELNGRITEKLS